MIFNHRRSTGRKIWQYASIWIPSDCCKNIELLGQPGVERISLCFFFCFVSLNLSVYFLFVSIGLSLYFFFVSISLRVYFILVKIFPGLFARFLSIGFSVQFPLSAPLFNFVKPGFFIGFTVASGLKAFRYGAETRNFIDYFISKQTAANRPCEDQRASKPPRPNHKGNSKCTRSSKSNAFYKSTYKSTYFHFLRHFMFKLILA